MLFTSGNNIGNRVTRYAGVKSCLNQPIRQLLGAMNHILNIGCAIWRFIIELYRNKNDFILVYTRSLCHKKNRMPAKSSIRSCKLTLNKVREKADKHMCLVCRHSVSRANIGRTASWSSYLAGIPARAFRWDSCEPRGKCLWKWANSGLACPDFCGCVC